MPNYKTGGTWTAIPAAALWSTYHGTYHVEYPAPTALTLAGLPCAAFGLPSIRIAAPLMADTGMAFWRAFFATTSQLYANISIEGLDIRTGLAGKWAGQLKWPVFSSVSWGSTAAKTMYRDVRIEIINCEVTA